MLTSNKLTCVNLKKGPRIRADRFLYRSDGNLVEHDLAVWSSVSRVEHFTVLFRVLRSFIVASVRRQPK
jgi:hypothetical protein